MSSDRTNTKEMWQGLAGCGCLSIILAFLLPPSIPIMVILFIIYLIVAIIRTPFSLHTEIKGKKVARHFEDAIKKEAPELLEEIDDDEE